MVDSEALNLVAQVRPLLRQLRFPPVRTSCKLPHMTEWRKRVYGIRKCGSRTRKLLDAGVTENSQWTVTVPSELATMFGAEQGFRWDVVDDGDGQVLVLVPVNEKPVRRGESIWTPEMDEIVMMKNRSLVELAEQLGKTVAAVGNRRWYLRKVGG